MQFNCDEVVSLVQKLCENFGAMDLQHDKASVTWTCLLALGFQNTCLCDKIGFLPVLMLDITVMRNWKGMG